MTNDVVQTFTANVAGGRIPAMVIEAEAEQFAGLPMPC
jgi:hydroxyethylthiazole kinase-like sugar kinase family protein